MLVRCIWVSWDGFKSSSSLVEKHCFLCYPAEKRGQEGFRQRRQQAVISIRHAVDRVPLLPKLNDLFTVLNVIWLMMQLCYVKEPVLS